MKLASDRVQQIVDGLKKVKKGPDKTRVLTGEVAKKGIVTVDAEMLAALLEELIELRTKAPAAEPDFTYEGLVAIIAENKAVSEEVADAIKAYVMDKNNPRQNRLYLWENTPERMAPRESYVCSIGAFNDIDPNFTFYDDLHTERYETVDLREVKDKSYFNDFIKGKQVLKKALWDQFADACMEEGYFVVTHDW